MDDIIKLLETLRAVQANPARLHILSPTDQKWLAGIIDRAERKIDRNMHLLQALADSAQRAHAAIDAGAEPDGVWVLSQEQREAERRAMESR